MNPLLIPDRYNDGYYWVRHKNKSIHYAEVVRFLTWRASDLDKTEMQLVYLLNKPHLTIVEFLKEYEVLTFIKHPDNEPMPDDDEEYN